MVIFANSMTAGLRAVFARHGALLAQVQRQLREQGVEHRIGGGPGGIQILAHRGVDLVRAFLQQRLLLRLAPRARPDADTRECVSSGSSAHASLTSAWLR